MRLPEVFGKNNSLSHNVRHDYAESLYQVYTKTIIFAKKYYGRIKDI